MAGNNKFDPNKYKGIFDKRYGKGTYNSMMSQAGELGRLKAQAGFEKDAAKQRIKDAEKAYKAKVKEEKKQRQYEAKQAAKDEAYQHAPDISAKTYYKKMNEAYSYGAQKRMEEDRRNRTVKASDLDKPKKKKKPKKEQKKDKGILGDLKSTAKTFGEFVNPFDDVSMKEALTKESKKERSKTSKTLNKYVNVNKAAEVISKPGDALRTGLDTKLKGGNFYEGVAAGLKGDRKTSGKELNKSLGFDPLTDKKDAQFAELFGKKVRSSLPTQFISKSTSNTKIGEETLGLGTEIVADPLNLAGTGILGKLAGSTSKVTKAPKITDKLDDVIDRVKLKKVADNEFELKLAERELKDVVNGSDPEAIISATKRYTELKESRNQNLTETYNRLSAKLPKEEYENISPMKDPGLIRVDDVDTPSHLDEMKMRANDLVKDGKEWRDQWSAAMYRETPDRIFDKAFGPDAPKMKATYIEPIKVREADRVRYLRNTKTEVDALYNGLKIKPGSKEDKLIQMYGEGKINDAELVMQTPNFVGVKKAAAWYRNYYDKVISELNVSLEKNGFDPIPKRDNYFPHFNDNGSVLKDIFGVDKTNHGLPTDINGLTEDFRPQKNFFGNAMRRKGDETSFGALQGLSGYVEGASNLLFHTDNIRNIRTLEKSIRGNFAETEEMKNMAAWLKEYGDQLAGKKGIFDRPFERIFGRQVYNATKTLQRNLGSALVGFNVSSAVTGVIPTLFAASQTSKLALTKALYQTVGNVVKNDGFINQSDFLTRRVGADPLFMTKYQKVTDKAFWMMEQVDNFNAQVITRGKYNELIANKVPHEEAIKQADNFAAEVMADRSKGQMPLLFNQRTLGPLTQFQLEVNNQLSHVFKDMPKNALAKGKNVPMKAFQVGAAFGQLALFGYMFNNLLEKVSGRRPAFDPVDYGITLFDAMNGDAKATEAIEKMAGQLPFTSFIFSGRLPVNAGLPDINEMMEKVDRSDGSFGAMGEEALNQAQKLPFLFVPGAGQIKKTVQGMDTFNEEAPGVYTDSGKMKYYVDPTLSNKVKGAVFGRGAFPETNAYYDNEGRFLSDRQTNEVIEADDQKAAYDNVLDERFERSLKDIEKSSDSEKEKQEKIRKLLKRLSNLKGE
jgi:hypothetical protein